MKLLRLFLVTYICASCSPEKGQDNSTSSIDSLSITNATVADSEEEMLDAIDELAGNDNTHLNEEKRKEYLKRLLLFTNTYPKSGKTPEILFQAAAYAENMQKYNQALNGYQKLIDQHSDFKQIDLVYYLKASLLDLSFRDKEKAIKAYTQFLDRFPDSPYVTEAKLRIDNIDLSIEEIVEKNKTQI